MRIAPSASDSPTPFVRGRRLAVVSVVVSATLAAGNVAIGMLSGSTSVVAIGVEFAGDVLASAVVLVGLLVAAKPPDANHPYGHGRLETVAGLIVGLILVIAGAAIAWRSLQELGVTHEAPSRLAIAALVVTIAVRAVMSTLKFRVARQIGSRALASDAWNDTVDILSAGAALVAVTLARVSPDRFLAADHYGGFAIGLIVVVTGVRIVRDATFDLADTMPEPSKIAQVREAAMSVPGVIDVEKQYARKTGLQYHIDLHIEVAPSMTVRESHRIAHDVQARVLRDVSWVAGVLVHVEPAGGDEGVRKALLQREGDERVGD